MRFAGLLCMALALPGCQASDTGAAAPHSEISETEEASVAAAGAPEPSGQPDPESTEAVPANTIRTVSCSATEEPLFSCKRANGKEIAVCASNEGEVEYRYGKDKAELVLSKPEWASVPYSGGGEAQIAFANGDTRYIVFSRMVRTNFEPGEPNNPAISDGVIVLRGENVLSVQACDGPGELKPVDYNVAERLIPGRKSELFTYETSRADPF